MQHSTSVDLGCGCPPIHVTADVEEVDCPNCGGHHLRLSARGEYMVNLGERVHMAAVHD